VQRTVAGPGTRNDFPKWKTMNAPILPLLPLSWLGQMVIARLRRLGRYALFFLQSFYLIFTWPPPVSKTIQQIYFIGMKSVSVICLTAIFIGMVLGLHGYYTLVKFGSEGVLGAAVALTLIRELGPVLTAIMLIGRAGSAMAAELGIMRISEQIDALQTMDIDPIRFLVSPKLAAALISMPLLTAMADVVGIIGGYLTGVVLLGIDSGIYFARIESSIKMEDVAGGFIKSLVFAVVLITVCCFKGYYTHEGDNFGAKGVSISTTSAVVLSSVLVLVTNYILTSLLL
jgi:phospholipid/cholesterol/gamma-HCH transport system permease protein